MGFLSFFLLFDKFPIINDIITPAAQSGGYQWNKNSAVRSDV